MTPRSDWLKVDTSCLSINDLFCVLRLCDSFCYHYGTDFLLFIYLIQPCPQLLHMHTRKITSSYLVKLVFAIPDVLLFFGIVAMIIVKTEIVSGPR